MSESCCACVLALSYQQSGPVQGQSMYYDSHPGWKCQASEQIQYSVEYTTCVPTIIKHSIESQFVIL